MTEATATEAPKTRKRGAQKGQPRIQKPFHLLISAVDENGNTIELHNDRVQIEVVKDPAVLLTMLTTGNMNGAVYKQFVPPAAAAPATNG